MRRPARIPQTARPETFLAPVRGWVENENIVANSGVGASVLENWVPMQSGVRVRGGSLLVADVGAECRSLIRYKSGATENLFAVTADTLYDISNLSIAAVETLTDLTESNSQWIHTQIATSGSEYLVMFNGADAGRYFSGTDWATYGGALDITGVDSADLAYVWQHGSRLWFIEKGTQVAWYLDTPDAIAGAASDLNLGSVFQKGGGLLIGGSLSSDSGDGMDDRCVFISTEGEVAIYSGTFPGADSWGLVGRYDLARPTSTETMKVGGDMLVATDVGIVPLSQVISRDPAALSMSAVTYPIEPAWRRVMASAPDRRKVRMLKITKLGIGVVGYTHEDECHVVNLTTGAWSRWTGHRIRCMSEYGDRGYWADSAGKVYLFEGAGGDDAGPFTSRMSMLPAALGALGGHKAVTMARATFRFTQQFKPKLSVAVNYSTEFPPAPDSFPTPDDGSLWDVGEWDVAEWASSDTAGRKEVATTRWVSIGRSGYAVAPQVQITNSGAVIPDVEFTSMTVLYSGGDTVV